MLVLGLVGTGVGYWYVSVTTTWQPFIGAGIGAIAGFLTIPAIGAAIGFIIEVVAGIVQAVIELLIVAVKFALFAGAAYLVYLLITVL